MYDVAIELHTSVYGRSPHFSPLTRVQILCERHVEADFLCESNLGVIEILLLSLKVSLDIKTVIKFVSMYIFLSVSGI